MAYTICVSTLLNSTRLRPYWGQK